MHLLFSAVGKRHEEVAFHVIIKCSLFMEVDFFNSYILYFRLLFEKYHDKLPIFVKIAKGVYGENVIDTVAQDEVRLVDWLIDWSSSWSVIELTDCSDW